MKSRSGAIALMQYILFRAAAGILRVFPISANLKAARWLARGWTALMPRHRERAITHLSAAYGSSLTSVQIESIAERCLEHWTQFAVELICAPRLINRWTWHEYLDPVNLNDTLRYLLTGKSAILVTGHYGNWELVGHLLACFGFDVAAVMRPLDNVYLNDHLVRTRATHGLRLIDKAGAAAEAEQLLADGTSLAFIADQDAGRKGVFVEFFGRPASTYKSIGLLAMHARVPIVIGYAERAAEGFRYRVGVERVITPEEWDEKEDPLAWITQTYMSAIERSARREPHQYLWMHRRWKTQPRARSSQSAVDVLTPAS